MKRCRICGQTKPIDAFYRASGARDGHRNECKACNLARRRVTYAGRREREIERVKQWQRDNPERYAARMRRYRESGRKAIANRKSQSQAEVRADTRAVRRDAPRTTRRLRDMWPVAR